MNDPAQGVDLGQLVATVAKAWAESSTSPQKLVAQPGDSGTTWPYNPLRYPDGSMTVGLIATPPFDPRFSQAPLERPFSATSRVENPTTLTSAIAAVLLTVDENARPSKTVGNGPTPRPRTSDSPTTPTNPKTDVEQAIEDLVNSNLLTATDAAILTGALAASSQDGHVDLSGLAFAAARGELTGPLALALVQALTWAAQRASTTDGSPSPQKMKSDLMEGCLLGASAGASIGEAFGPGGAVAGGVAGCVVGGLGLAWSRS